MSYLLIFLFYLILTPMLDLHWLSILGIALATVEIGFFYKKIDKSFQIYKYGLIVAILQWFIAPLIDYHFFNTHYLYHMYVPEEEYMRLAVPSLFFYKVGLDFYSKEIEDKFESIKNSLAHLDAQALNKMGMLLLLIGFTFTFLLKIADPGLSFLFYLLSNLKYVGGIILFYYGKKSGLIINFLLFGLLFFDSLAGGTFHELLLWFILLLPFYLIKTTAKTYLKPIIFIIFCLMTFVIQSLKEDYREVVWFTKTGNQNNLEVFSELLKTKEDKKEFSSDNNLHNMIIRFNQGWIISKVLHHVPVKEEFANGETIVDAFYASFVPRIFNPDKSGAGGQILFKRFSGLKLSKSASMGVSILGEGYANFGIVGSYIFMFLWGVTLAFLISYHLRFSESHPYLIFFIPWIYIDSVKAETDFITMLNYLTKAYLLLLILCFLFKKLGPNLSK